MSTGAPVISAATVLFVATLAADASAQEHAESNFEEFAEYWCPETTAEEENFVSGIGAEGFEFAGICASTDDGDSGRADELALNSEVNSRFYTVDTEFCQDNQIGMKAASSCDDWTDEFCRGGQVRRARTYDRARDTSTPVAQTQYCLRAQIEGQLPEGIDRQALLEAMPQPTPIQTDHGGLGLRNAHTNFYTSGEDVLVPFDLEGTPVWIRLMPTAFIWGYGDGSGWWRTTDPGAPAEQFDTETATSHVYEDTGFYAVTLATEYRAEFLFADQDAAVPFEGTITVNSPVVIADIWRVRSKNVDRNCVQDPSGWGCDSPFQEDPEREGVVVIPRPAFGTSSAQDSGTGADSTSAPAPVPAGPGRGIGASQPSRPGIDPQH